MTENGEAFTPKEEMQIKVELLARDLFIASKQLHKLSFDPMAAQFIATVEGDLWSVRNTMIELCDFMKNQEAA